jgi:putative PIN family toxin of toxin-antitoxin system
VVVSPALLREYRDTPKRLRDEGRISREQLGGLIAAIAAFVAEAKVVERGTKLSVCRDPSDDHLLECCLAADVSVLLTGDHDLLDLDPEVVARHVPGLRILAPRGYLQS